jgi:hypothetical protein
MCLCAHTAEDNWNLKPMAIYSGISSALVRIADQSCSIDVRPSSHSAATHMTAAPKNPIPVLQKERTLNNDRKESGEKNQKPETYELPLCPYCAAPVDFTIDGGIVWAAFCTNEDCGRFSLEFNDEYLGID